MTNVDKWQELINGILGDFAGSIVWRATPDDQKGFIVHRTILAWVQKLDTIDEIPSCTENIKISRGAGGHWNGFVKGLKIAHKDDFFVTAAISSHFGAELSPDGPAKKFARLGQSIAKLSAPKTDKLEILAEKAKPKKEVLDKKPPPPMNSIVVGDKPFVCKICRSTIIGSSGLDPCWCWRGMLADAKLEAGRLYLGASWDVDAIELFMDSVKFNKNKR